MWDLGNAEHNASYPVSRNHNEVDHRRSRQDSYPYASAPYVANAPSQGSQPHSAGVPYQSPYLQHSSSQAPPPHGGFLSPPQSPRHHRRHSDSHLSRPQIPHNKLSNHSSPEARSRDAVVIQTVPHQERHGKLKRNRHSSSYGQTYTVSPNQVIHIAPEAAGLPLIIQNGRIVSSQQPQHANSHSYPSSPPMGTSRPSHSPSRPHSSSSRPHNSSSRPHDASSRQHNTSSRPHDSPARRKQPNHAQEDRDRGFKEDAQKILSFLNIDFEYSKCTGRRKALCIGINYIQGPDGEQLNGCINDARNIRNRLIKKWNYKPEDIVMLTDDSSHPRSLPTRKNMIDAMKWLVKDAHPHDSLVFHYSGHGGQIDDLDGDEVDHKDEVIFPMDHEKYGVIVDDELHDIMVKPLPKGCRLTAIFDSCHSGTMLDLPFIYSAHGRLKESLTHPRAIKSKSSPADVISWAGCQDGQTSADTFTAGNQALAVGAMSHAFLKVLEENRGKHLSYLDVLTQLRRRLYSKYTQRPQLTSSHPIDTSLEFIM